MKSSEPECVWILSCEAIKASSDSQQRYELKVAVLLPDHYQLDEKLNSFAQRARISISLFRPSKTDYSALRASRSL